jgi:hypothetical protein
MRVEGSESVVVLPARRKRVVLTLEDDGYRLDGGRNDVPVARPEFGRVAATSTYG